MRTLFLSQLRGRHISTDRCQGAGRVQDQDQGQIGGKDQGVRAELRGGDDGHC